MPEVILRKLYVPTGWQPEPEDRIFSVENMLNEVETYLHSVINGAGKAYELPPNPALHTASKWLVENQNIVKLTDKNLGVTVLSNKWYHNQIMNLLQHETYDKVDNPAPELSAIAIIAEKIVEKIKNPHIRCFLLGQPKGTVPTCHWIPKVHKTPRKVRPIVPCHSSHITPAAKVLEAHLSLYLKKLPWIINSTREFVERLEKGKVLSHPDEIHLVTADVEAFYTNIPLDMAIRKIEMIMEGHHDVKGLLTVKETNKVARFVNHNVYFEYNGDTFHQAKGLAMGAQSSGAIANL